MSSGNEGGSGVDRGAGPASAAVDAVIALASSRPPRLGRVRLICVDGPAGSGKTTFAGDMTRAVRERGRRAQLVHMDDLYDGWTGLDGDLWPRLSAQVLEPLRRGWAGRFQRYDWVAEHLADWVDVPVPEVLVLEGCGSGRRAAQADASAIVWVEADSDLRLRRGLERDGAQARPQWERWMADEVRHFEREGTRGRADFRLDAYGRMTV